MTALGGEAEDWEARFCRDTLLRLTHAASNPTKCFLQLFRFHWVLSIPTSRQEEFLLICFDFFLSSFFKAEIAFLFCAR